MDYVSTPPGKLPLPACEKIHELPGAAEQPHGALGDTAISSRRTDKFYHEDSGHASGQELLAKKAKRDRHTNQDRHTNEPEEKTVTETKDQSPQEITAACD